MMTCIVGFVVCWMIQIDSFVLIKKLSQDDSFRNAMVAQAEKAIQRYDQLKKVTDSPAAPPQSDERVTQTVKPPAADMRETLKKAKNEVDQLTEVLRDPKLDVIPAKYSWQVPIGDGFRAGILFSGILVSLGAPFWYDLLKKLLGLRSLLAQKDDAERKGREDSQEPANSPPPSSAAQIKVLGEQPDLVEVKVATDLRSGAPSGSSPSAGIAVVQTLVPVTATVEGDAAGNSNNKWFRTTEGNYLWAGATDKA